MAYEVVTVRFRSELHARWSVFFDVLEVPWTYEPVTFHASDGTSCTPAFWLPRERIWFAAEQDRAPSWWGRFAATASNREYHGGLWEEPEEEDEESVPDGPLIEVGEEWQGEALLCLGPVPSGYNCDAFNGPWDHHEAYGMYTDWDAAYRWTLCPECGLFGAQYFGYAERLPCRCIDDHERRKIDNSADKRLLAAYRAAATEHLLSFGEDDAVPCTPRAFPIARRAVVRQPGAARAQELCVWECGSVGEQLRADLPAGAYAEVTEDADVLCGGCPGFVCVVCGERPASAAGAACWVCEPVNLLTYSLARQRLNDKAGEAGHRAKRPARDINTLINRAQGVRQRGEASLEQLAEAWDSGASQWTAARRPAYANDLDAERSLVAVTAKTNRSKADPDGRITEFPLPDRAARPHAVTVDGQGTAWFTEWGGNRVGRITPDGSVTVHDLPTPRSEPHGITVGPDGALWTALEIGSLARIAPPDSTA